MSGQDTSHKLKIRQKAPRGNKFKIFYTKFTSGYMAEIIH
jgi:hypothetical protein